MSYMRCPLRHQLYNRLIARLMIYSKQRDALGCKVGGTSRRKCFSSLCLVPVELSYFYYCISLLPPPLLSLLDIRMWRVTGEENRRKNGNLYTGKKNKRDSTVTFMKNFWLIAREKVDNDVIGLESSLTDRPRSSACYVCVFYRYTYFKINIYIYISIPLFKYLFYQAFLVIVPVISARITSLTTKDLEISSIRCSIFLFFLLRWKENWRVSLIGKWRNYGDPFMADKSYQTALLHWEIREGEQVDKCARNVHAFCSNETVDRQVLCETWRYPTVGHPRGWSRFDQTIRDDAYEYLFV